jgi:hypothetical protein
MSFVSATICTEAGCRPLVDAESATASFLTSFTTVMVWATILAGISCATLALGYMAIRTLIWIGQVAARRLSIQNWTALHPLLRAGVDERGLLRAYTCAVLTYARGGRLRSAESLAYLSGILKSSSSTTTSTSTATHSAGSFTSEDESESETFRYIQ